MSEENPTPATSRWSAKKYTLKLSLAISLFVGISLLFFFVGQNERQVDIGHLRRLSLANDLHTGENVRTVNGTIPEVSCPLG